MNVTRKQLAERAIAHLGDDSPVNTCMSLGMNKWPQELGLPGIGTNSVSEAEERARAGYNGWEYHEGDDGLQLGDWVDWDPAVLATMRDRHVSAVVEMDEFGRWKSIGAGGPTGQVWWQPRNKGFNPPAYVRGYFRVPLGKSPAKARTKTGPVQKAETYTVKRGDILLRIAAASDTTVGKLVKLNGLRNPDHIEVGQKLRLR